MKRQAIINLIKNNGGNQDVQKFLVLIRLMFPALAGVVENELTTGEGADIESIVTGIETRTRDYEPILATLAAQVARTLHALESEVKADQDKLADLNARQEQLLTTMTRWIEHVDAVHLGPESEPYDEPHCNRCMQYEQATVAARDRIGEDTR